MRALLLSGLVFVAACSCEPRGNPDGGADAGADGGIDAGDITITFDVRSGSRIKTQMLVTVDGARRFVGSFDSARASPCSWVVAADGATRCLADAVLVSDFYFLDPGCTQPLVSWRRSVSCALPSVVRVDDDSVCPPRQRRHALGAELTSLDGGTSVAVYTGGPGSCSATNVSTSSTRLFRVGAEVPASSFIAATRSTVELSPSLARVVLAGEDDSQANDGLEERPSQRTCSVGTAKDLKDRCLPVSGAFVSPSLFSDSSCRLSVLQERVTACPAPTTATRADAACGAVTTTAFAVGAPITSLFRQVAACAPEAPTAGQRYYGVGNELAPTSLPETPRVDGRTFGRLMERDYRLGAGFLEFSDFFDTELGVPCTFLTASDGESRCLPTPQVQASAFRDAACTERIAVSSSSCASPSHAFLLDFTGCPVRLAVFPITGRYTGTVYGPGGGSCGVLTSPPGMWTLGPELPPTRFVAGTLETR